MMKHAGSGLINTKRLILRKFKIEDANDMFNNWAKDPENVEHLSWPAHNNLSETKRILNRWIEGYQNDNCYRWCIEAKGNNEVIGCIDVVLLLEDNNCCEIGYVLSKKYWNLGIMSEALEAVMAYLFRETDCNRVQSRHHVENPASGKVMIKSGMKFEGVLRQFEKNKTGGYGDSAIYSILKYEWNKNQGDEREDELTDEEMKKY